jgi:hypothetical protein
MATKTQKHLVALMVPTILASSCAYTPNTISDIERKPVTERSAKYRLEEITSEGKAYHIVEKGDFKLGDNEYKEVPFLMQSNEVREVIDDEKGTITVDSKDKYALVPVYFDEKGKMHVAKADDETREIISFPHIQLKPRNIKKGFTVSRRTNLDDKFKFDNINVGDEVFYVFRHAFEVKDSANGTYEGLPVGFMKQEGSKRILDRSKGYLELNGEVYMPVKATKVKLEKNPKPEIGKATEGRAEKSQ